MLYQNLTANDVVDIVQQGRRSLDGKRLDAADIFQYVNRGWRMYDLDCGYTMSHTKSWCGHTNCPNG
jgi:hypothetical protein